RQKLGLFGGTAPSPSLFVNARNNFRTSLPRLINDWVKPWVWRDSLIAHSDQVDLSATCTKAVVGSWFALTRDGLAQLYKVKRNTAVSLAKFAMSAKVTELAADYEDLSIS